MTNVVRGLSWMTVVAAASLLNGCTNFRGHGGSVDSGDASVGDVAPDSVAGSGGSDAGRGTGGVLGTGGNGLGGSNGFGGHGSGGSGEASGGNMASGGTDGSGGFTGSGGTGAGGQNPTGSGGMLGSGGAAAAGGKVPAGSGGAGGASDSCTSTQRLCSGACVPKSSTEACGPNCLKCTPPSGGTPSCDGTTCDFTCGTMKKCAAAGICVGPSGCCSNTDCPAMPSGQTGTCDSGTHMCNYSCPAMMQACTTGTTVTCISSSACCNNSDCPGNCKTCSAAHACVPALNMDDPNGRCAGTCDTTGTCKGKQGQLCTAVAAGCTSGTTCVDGYCCNSPCQGSCQACDIQPGMCTNVNSGTPHGNHLACGTDAACLGTCLSGQCSYATKACGSGPMCSGNGSEIKQSMCATGKCVTPTANACLTGYACSGTGCAMSCSGTSTGCAPTYHCSNGACAAPLQPGAVCVNDVDCSSSQCGDCSGGSCTKRCCNDATPCSCPQKSNANRLTNPGFDQNLSGWIVTAAPPGSPKWTGADDAMNCPVSGSLKIQGSAQTAFFQCVAIQTLAGYSWGMQWKSGGGAGDSFNCEGTLITVPQGMPCDQTSGVGMAQGVGAFYSSTSPTTWSPIQLSFDSTVNDGTYTHLYIECFGMGNVEVDMAYATPSGQGTF